MLSSFAYFIVRYNITALLSWHSEVYNVLWLFKLGNAIKRFMTLHALVVLSLQLFALLKNKIKNNI